LSALIRPSLPVRHWTVRRNAGRRSSAWRAAPGPALAGNHHVAHTQLVQGIVDAFLPVAAVGGDGSRFAYLNIRHHGQFAYVDGKLPDGTTLPLFRLRSAQPTAGASRSTSPAATATKTPF